MSVQARLQDAFCAMYAHMIPLRPRKPPVLEEAGFFCSLSLTFFPMFWAPPADVNLVLHSQTFWRHLPRPYTLTFDSGSTLSLSTLLPLPSVSTEKLLLALDWAAAALLLAKTCGSYRSA